MRGVIAWFREAAWTLLLGCAIGVAVGIAIRYPTGWQLASDTAALWGAFAGSAVAVSGAFLLWRAQEKRAARSAVDAIVRMVTPVFDRLKDFLVFDRENYQQVFSLNFGALKTEIERTQENLRRFDNRWQALAASQVAEFLEVEVIFRRILQKMDFMMRGSTNERVNNNAKAGQQVLAGDLQSLRAQVERLAAS